MFFSPSSTALPSRSQGPGRGFRHVGKFYFFLQREGYKDQQGSIYHTIQNNHDPKLHRVE